MAFISDIGLALCAVRVYTRGLSEHLAEAASTLLIAGHWGPARWFSDRHQAPPQAGQAAKGRQGGGQGGG